MKNSTKIVLGIIIAIIIIVLISVVLKDKKIDNNEVENQQNKENIFDYLNNITSDENKINNKIENNETESNLTTSENLVNNIQNTNNSSVIGQEEQESTSENTEINNKEIAIELAKEEWGISVDSYDFQADLQSDGIYVVTVRNKVTRDEITRYTVNIKTGAVTEAQ